MRASASPCGQHSVTLELPIQVVVFVFEPQSYSALAIQLCTRTIGPTVWPCNPGQPGFELPVGNGVAVRLDRPRRLGIHMS